jgi:hypothetical protein
MDEVLRFLYAEEQASDYLITVQLSGGGAAMRIPKNAEAADVVHRLRMLASLIEDDVYTRGEGKL